MIEVLIIKTIVEATPLGYLFDDVADVTLAASITILIAHNFQIVHILYVDVLNFLLRLVMV